MEAGAALEKFLGRVSDPRSSLPSMADLDKMLGALTFHTSGAGALKPYKNHKVRHYAMGTTAQT